MTGFKLYENKSNDEIVELFDSLFKIGFKLEFSCELYENFSTKKRRDTKPESNTQLFSCINQNSINPFIINFLIQTLKDDYNYTNSMMQDELVKVLKIITYLFYLSVYYNQPKLEKNYYLIIILTLFPMLDEASIIKLRKSCYVYTRRLVFEAVQSIFLPTYQKFFEGVETCSIFLFKRKIFKIIDLFFQYKLLHNKEHIEMFDYLCDLGYYYKIPFKLRMEYIVTYVYLLFVRK